MSDLDLDELRATYDHPADKSVIEVIDRLEQAEQAVQRVREVHKPARDPFGTSCAVCIGDSRRNPYPCPTIRALDGDTRRLADQGLGDKLAHTTKNGETDD